MKKYKALITKNHWVIAITLFFVVLNAALMIGEFYYLLVLPLVLFAVYLAFVSLDTLFFILVFFVPVSVPLQLYMPSLGFNVQLPTDPLLVLILLVFIGKVIYEKRFDKRVLTHPVSIAIYIHLTWLFVTSLTSSMPLVSFKFLISRIWFLITFYFVASQIFRTKQGIIRFMWTYIPLMVLVMVIVWIRMAQHGFFNEQEAHAAPCPFFNDHTAYGSVLAMLLPFMVGFTQIRKFPLPTRILSWLLVVAILFALLLSYCRAAWLSIVVTALVFGLVKLKIKFHYAFVGGIIVLGLIYRHQEQLFLHLEHNRQNSSKNIEKHIESMTNIETDVSNLERINRWKSALRMFRERPIFGWGPGTYAFQYAPFQMSYDRTPISTDQGNGGNAHSEYIGALAESGVPGCLTFILLLIVSLYSGLTLYRKLRPQKKLSSVLVLSATLGLITYFAHATLNNFLDTDKDSALFWGYMAMIVAIEVYHSGKTAESSKRSEFPAL